MSQRYPEWWKCWVCHKKLDTFGCPDPFFRHEDGLANWLCVPCWEKAQDIFDRARYEWRDHTKSLHGHRRPPARQDVEK